MRKLAALLVLLTVLAPLRAQPAAAAPPGTGPGVVEGDRDGGWWVLTSPDGATYSLERWSRGGFNNDRFRATTTNSVAMAYDAAADALWYHDGPTLHRYLERQVGGSDTVVATLTDIGGMDVAPDGTLYVVDGGRIRRLTSTGTTEDVAGTEGLVPAADVAVAPDGSLRVLAGDVLYEVVGGARTAVWSGFTGAAVLDVATDGTTYVGETSGRRVLGITADRTKRTVMAGIDPVVSLAVSGPDLLYVTRPSTGGRGTATHVRDVATWPSRTPSTPPAAGQGYRFVAGDGGVFSFGAARFLGSTGSIRLHRPIVGGAALPGGYWLVAGDGGVFSFGAAPFLGSAVGAATHPVVAMVPTSDGKGYWVIEEDGTVHAYGSAPDVSPVTVGRVVGAAASFPNGLVVVGSDGRVQVRGLTVAPGAGPLRGSAQPVVGIGARPDEPGWWVVTADGTVISSGPSPTFGSMAGKRLNAPIVDVVVTPSGQGYWLLGADGGVFSFGDARFLGSTGSRRLNRPIVGAVAG